MFKVEYVVAQNRDYCEVVERIDSEAANLAQAEKTARWMLDAICAGRNERKLDGFQIRNAAGDVLFRSWPYNMYPGSAVRHIRTGEDDSRRRAG